MSNRIFDPKSKAFRHLSFLCDFRNTLSFEECSEKLNKKLDELESKMESHLITLLEDFQIQATIKTDKKSLPYNNEILITLPNESYVVGVLEFKRCYRTILKELIEKNLYKIRFYVSIELTDFGMIGGLIYKFRYYTTSNQTV